MILLQKKRDLKDEPSMHQQHKGDNNANIFSNKNSMQNLGVQFEERTPQDEEAIPPIAQFSNENMINQLADVIGEVDYLAMPLEADFREVKTPKKLLGKPKSFV